MKIPQFITHNTGLVVAPFEALAFVILFLASVAGAVFCLAMVVQCVFAGHFSSELGIVLLGALFCVAGALVFAWVIWRNVVPKRPGEAELRTPAESSSALSYATLVSRMEEMAAIGGDEVEIDHEARFLLWDDRAMRDLVIQGLGGDDYVAFFWPLVGEATCLSPIQLAQLCQREDVQLPEDCRSFQPGAVAFCRGGHLRVYPASAMADLAEHHPPMQDDESFRRWMTDVRKCGALDV